MATTVHDFELSRRELGRVLEEVYREDEPNLVPIEEKIAFLGGSDSDKKSTLELVFRDVLCSLNRKESSPAEYRQLLDLSMEAAKKEMCSFVSSINLLSDVFELATIDRCEEVFEFVESKVDTWKQSSWFDSVKNHLLRLCNDLLRRLSRSQNTVFCGRILLFLAKFFPLSERSGLNIVSEFNLDNVTLFSSKEELDMGADKDEPPLPPPSPDNKPIHVDYNLYRKFWSLQDYFRNPNQCYNKLQWRMFQAHGGDVLSAFGSFKLDDVKFAHNTFNQDIAQNSDKPMYFAKYLTNQKLLDLQLADSNFRRYVLIQFLILFQYLTTPVKFKSDTYSLTDEQAKWIKDTTDIITKLLEETPPDGATFSKAIQHILAREENWSNWKNDGCPDFSSVEQTEDQQQTSKPAVKPTRKRKLGEEVRASVSQRKVLMGNPELSRLWNLCPDNMEACRQVRRDFLPSLESFFEEAVVESDPANMIEDQYKHIYNSNWGWRALRLLARRSPHFFTPSNQPISKLPLYLEAMIKKLAKDFPQQPFEVIKSEPIDTAEGADDMDDDLLKQEEIGGAGDAALTKEEAVNPNLVTTDQIKRLAPLVGSFWKDLALILQCDEDEIAYFESEHSDLEELACKMLTVWQEKDPEEGTTSVLWLALKEVGLVRTAEDVLGPQPID